MSITKQPRRNITICCPACKRWSSLAYFEKAIRSDNLSFEVVSSIMHGLGRGRGFEREDPKDLGVEGLSDGTKAAILKKLKAMVSVLESS